MYWGQTESSKCPLDSLSHDLGRPFIAWTVSNARSQAGGGQGLFEYFLVTISLPPACSLCACISTKLSVGRSVSQDSALGFSLTARTPVSTGGFPHAQTPRWGSLARGRPRYL
eukprot:scaffold51715_cov30-Phaeocystis_antarctica.AAC.1